MKKIFSLAGLKVAAPWILITLGLITLSYGQFGHFKEEVWGKFWTSIGESILAGGIFTVFLKTFQFLGVFKDELSSIIYDPTHLAKRKDLPDLWAKMSALLFDNKFPKIAQKITNDVRGIYFPVNHVLYYDNYKQEIEIELIKDEEGVIKVTEVSEFTIIPRSIEAFSLKASNLLCFNKEASEVSFKVLSFKINGNDTTFETISEVSNSNFLKTSYEIPLKGKKAYKVETRIEKIYSIHYDNLMGTIKDYLINNYYLKVYLKGRIDTTFLEVGTLNKFERPGKFKREGVKEYSYSGLLYPKQGYLMILKKVVE